MKKTRIISMFLAVALVVSCFSVALAADPVEFIFPGQKQELALGDWTGVVQSNPQNTPSVSSNGYLSVETTAYPQGVELVTTDSAYVLDETKDYTVEIKIRTAAADVSYYRAYCGAGAPSAFSGDYEVKPASWIGSGFPVEGDGWTVVSGDFNKKSGGQLGIKIHGGAVGGVYYCDGFDIDYIKVTEKGTDNVLFCEDFDDAELNCTYNGINGAANVSVQGITAGGSASGGYIAVETTAYPQGIEFVTAGSEYVLDAEKTYTFEIKMRTAAEGTSYYRIYCGGGAPGSLSGDYEIKPADYVSSGGNGFPVAGDDGWVVKSGDVKANTSGQLGIKIHGGSVGGTFGDSFDVEYIKITEKGTNNVFFYEDFEDAELNCTYALINNAVGVSLEGIASYVAGNGYVHVANRMSAVSGAAYTSADNLTGGEEYTLKITMRASNTDEYIRAFAFGKEFACTKLPNSWTELTAKITPETTGQLSIYIHNGSNAPARYVHGFTEFDIDSLVVTDSTGAAVINETYDDGVGNWVSHADRGGYTPKQSAVISHEVENDYATVPGSAATYIPAEEMSLKAGTYVVSGTFKVPYNRANLAVARALKMSGDEIASYLAPTVVIADYNKVNVGAMIVDTDGNRYYAEENSVPVATSWVEAQFEIEIPNNIVVDYISFFGQDGVTPVAGEYALGSETVKVGLLKDNYDAATDDDTLENSPMLVDILNNGVSQIYDHVNGNYATIEGTEGYLADAVIPFQFRDAQITMTKLKPVESTDASPVGILAMLLLKRAMNNNTDENVDDDKVAEDEKTGDVRYLRVETTEYPQGVEFVTEDSAYILDESKEYTLEIKMRIEASASYYRAYCAGGAPSTFSGDYEIKPETWVSSGFPVAGTDWVIVSGDVKAGVSGQLGIKIHGGSVSGVAYGDSFEIDYIKVTEKGTDNVFFYEDFEDDEINCTYNVINNAVGAAVKGK